jgi:hypothetical protein
MGTNNCKKSPRQISREKYIEEKIKDRTIPEIATMLYRLEERVRQADDTYTRLKYPDTTGS